MSEFKTVDVSYPYKKGVNEVEIISFRTGRTVKGKIDGNIKMYRLAPARYLLWRAGRTSAGYDITVSVIQVSESGAIELFSFDLWKGIQVRSLSEIPLRIRELLESNADRLPFFDAVEEPRRVISRAGR